MPKYIVVRHTVDNISPKVAYLTDEPTEAEIMKARLNSAVNEVLKLKKASEEFLAEFEQHKPAEKNDEIMKAYRIRRKNALNEWMQERLSPLAFKLYLNAGEAHYEVEVVDEALIIW